MIKYKIGNLFVGTEHDSLAHCISKDCHMGAGIAVEFKRRFGNVINQKKHVGECAVLHHNSRYIYYLITKHQYFQKPTLNNLKLSLEHMKKHCINYGVTNLSMPKIGCGLDQLNWTDVCNLINNVFSDTNIIITIYMLP